MFYSKGSFQQNVPDNSSRENGKKYNSESLISLIILAIEANNQFIQL